MPTYTLTFEGREHVSKKVECGTLADAQNEAVRYLGAYLADHPGFATEGHWRVNVEDETHRQLLHVIVATVTSKYVRDLRATDMTAAPTP
jgi:hypothetical protein